MSINGVAHQNHPKSYQLQPANFSCGDRCMSINRVPHQKPICEFNNSNSIGVVLGVPSLMDIPTQRCCTEQFHLVPNQASIFFEGVENRLKPTLAGQRAAHWNAAFERGRKCGASPPWELRFTISSPSVILLIAEGLLVTASHFAFFLFHYRHPFMAHIITLPRRIIENASSSKAPTIHRFIQPMIHHTRLAITAFRPSPVQAFAERPQRVL